MYVAAAAAAKSCQSYLTLCDPIDGSLQGSAIRGILQARTLLHLTNQLSTDGHLGCFHLLPVPQWMCSYLSKILSSFFFFWMYKPKSLYI